MAIWALSYVEGGNVCISDLTRTSMGRFYRAYPPMLPPISIAVQRLAHHPLVSRVNQGEASRVHALSLFPHMKVE